MTTSFYSWNFSWIKGPVHPQRKKNTHFCFTYSVVIHPLQGLSCSCKDVFYLMNIMELGGTGLWCSKHQKIQISLTEVHLPKRKYAARISAERRCSSFFRCVLLALWAAVRYPRAISVHYTGEKGRHLQNSSTRTKIICDVFAYR